MINLENKDIFEIGDILLSDNDKLVLEKITGYSYDELIFDIKKSDTGILELIYSSEKIILDSVLNKKGLHIFRTLLAYRIDQYRRRKYSKDLPTEYVEEWENNGILILPDFLEEGEYHKLKEYANKSISSGNPVGYDISTNLKFQKLITMTAAAPSNIFSLGLEKIDFDSIDPAEEQYNLHSDTFQPCIKVFYYINDVKEDEGPFCFVKSSNRVDNPELLKWLYDASCIALDNTMGNILDILPYPLSTKTEDTWGKPEICTFSPRLKRLHSDDVLNRELHKLGLPDISPIVGKDNTMVIANTGGLHRRGRAKKGVIRTVFRSGQRFNPFML